MSENLKLVVEEERPMVQSVAKKLLSQGEQRHRLLWYTVGWLCAAVFVGVGSGYAVGKHTQTAETALKLLSNLEGGSLSFHGWAMLVLAMFMCFSMGTYTRLTWLALVAMTFYSLVTAILIFAGWFFNPVAWGAPWWYLFVAGLSISLMAYAPPIGTPGLRARK